MYDSYASVGPSQELHLSVKYWLFDTTQDTSA